MRLLTLGKDANARQTPQHQVQPRGSRARPLRPRGDRRLGEGPQAARGPRPSRVPDRTLRIWKETQYADRFREIAANHTREVRDTIAQEQIEIAIAAGDVERVALAKVHSQIEDAELKDVSTAGRNAAVSKGIALDKHLLYRGEPTQIVRHQQASDILAQIKKIAPGLVVEGDAQDVEGRSGS